MIKQTRGAIKFLLADYRAVLKYAMMAAAGIALSSPSYATTFADPTGTIFDDPDGTTISTSKDFTGRVQVYESILELEDGNYTADSVWVSGYQYGNRIMTELALHNATLTTSSANKIINDESEVEYYDTFFVTGKLSLSDAKLILRADDHKHRDFLTFAGGNSEAAFSGDVYIDGSIDIDSDIMPMIL